MFKELWHSFVPTEQNDYRPYVLRAWPVAILFLVIIGLYGASSVAELSLTSKGGYLAAVVSSVLVDLTNFDRAGNDLHGLAVNPVLQKAAQEKADDMAAKSYFAHNSPDGKTPWYWFSDAGYQFAYAGENLAVYFTDSADVERAWMNSPGHRANILSPYFTEIGIATAQGMYQGQPTTFVVQEFGAPVTPTPTLSLASSTPAGSGQATTTTPKVAGSATTTPVKPAATTTPKTVAIVKGEATTSPPEPLTVIHEDEQFIAVKNTAAVAAPSANPVAMQSTLLERLLTSPQTVLNYAYLAIGTLVFLALLFLTVFEFKKQRPLNVAFAILLIVVMGVILYLSGARVLVESAQAALF